MLTKFSITNVRKVLNALLVQMMVNPAYYVLLDMKKLVQNVFQLQLERVVQLLEQLDVKHAQLELYANHVSIH